MKREFNLYLKDIIVCIGKIREYTNSLDFKKFKENSMVMDAVIRNLEVIGEATSQLPQEVKDRYPDMQWQEIKNLRNIVVPKYHSIDFEILWDIIENKLGPLEIKIKRILKAESQKD
ncbi:DUF86 domain-containing protein [Candidatus Woesearchaeota archaeon]|nr:DUF86 domain-containing protein [Candidatus Woesearchaeota archaeon]